MSELAVSPSVRLDWKRHQRNWSDCKLCNLCKSRDEVVLARGKIPADILFIGEAPGYDEDALGYPFVGRSGKLLDQIILASQSIRNNVNSERSSGKRLRDLNYKYCISNIVACIPAVQLTGTDKHGATVTTHGVRVPNDFEVEQCRPRLAELIEMVQPKGIVLLGKVAEQHFDPTTTLPLLQLLSPEKSEFPILNLKHPSFLLRNGGASHRNKYYKETWWELRKFVREVMKGGGQ